MDYGLERLKPTKGSTQSYEPKGSRNADMSLRSIAFFVYIQEAGKLKVADMPNNSEVQVGSPGLGRLCRIDNNAL
jgi:hypothetical protein